MGTTAPAWLEIIAAVIVFGGVLAFVVWAIVLWVVRLRFPPDTYERLVPRGDDLVHEVLGPGLRVTREAAVPSAHQPAARRPGWRGPAGPSVPQATTVRLRITAQPPRRPAPGSPGSGARPREGRGPGGPEELE